MAEAEDSPPEDIDKRFKAALGRIRATLPADTDPEKLRRLPWIAYALRPFVEQSADERRREWAQFDRIAKAAKELNAALSALDPEAERALRTYVHLLAAAAEKGTPEAFHSPNEPEELWLLRALLPPLIAGIETKKPKPGPRVHSGKGMVMYFIGDLFFWLTGQIPKRAVNRMNGADTGPLFKFAAAMWREIFGNDESLLAALRRWNKAPPAWTNLQIFAAMFPKLFSESQKAEFPTCMVNYQAISAGNSPCDVCAKNAHHARRVAIRVARNERAFDARHRG